MSRKAELLRNRASALVAGAMILLFLGLTRAPHLSSVKRNELASRFHFTEIRLPETDRNRQKFVRVVHPSLNRISAWISATGAAVSLADIDGDGLPNDYCLVDPRVDQVIVAPVPETGERFQSFALDPSPLPYDASTMAPKGTLLGDFNEDGLADIFVYYWGRTPVVFLRKSGDVPGTATDQDARLTAANFIPSDVVPSGQRWYSNAATSGDFDGDGHVDIVIGNYFPDEARILDARAGGVEVMHNTKSKSFNGGWNRMLLWSGSTSGERPTARYTEVPEAFDDKVARGWTLAVGAADLDGDLLPEIYFANDFGPDRLLHNRSAPGQPRFAVLHGERSWTTPKSSVLGDDSFKGMGVDFGDVNGDGVLDIYVSNIATEFGLQESHFLWMSAAPMSRMQDGIAPYVQASERLGLSRSGWGWESRLADFDNDGVLEAIQALGFIQGSINRWPELQSLATANDRMIHNPQFWPRFQPGDDLCGRQRNAFFVRSTDGRFHDVAPELGIDNEMGLGRGIAVADAEGDGDLDFVVANQWGPSYYFRNDSPSAHAILGLYLLLPVQTESSAVLRIHMGPPEPGDNGRAAVGAAAVVRLPDGRRLVGQVDGGNGHSGKRSQQLHFGLGPADADARLPVDLQWRDEQGRICRSTVDLSPGWHTVLLGCRPEGEERDETR